jgi:hypothetical protein
MPIAITAAYKNVGYDQTGPTRMASILCAITGLTASADNAVSLTSDGTVAGTPLLPKNASPLLAQVYIPLADGGWYEAAVMSRDAVNNMVFHIHVDAGGPTTFRLGLLYGT